MILAWCFMEHVLKDLMDLITLMELKDLITL